MTRLGVQSTGFTELPNWVCWECLFIKKTKQKETTNGGEEKISQSNTQGGADGEK